MPDLTFRAFYESLQLFEGHNDAMPIVKPWDVKAKNVVVPILTAAMATMRKAAIPNLTTTTTPQASGNRIATFLHQSLPAKNKFAQQENAPKSGYPDYFLTTDCGLVALEVKSRESASSGGDLRIVLTGSTKKIRSFLNSHGVGSCYHLLATVNWNRDSLSSSGIALSFLEPDLRIKAKFEGSVSTNILFKAGQVVV